MPRSGWTQPFSDRHLSDNIAVGVLTRVFPPALVDEVLARTGRSEHRLRLLPARLMVYYVLTLALFPDLSYEEVMVQLTEGRRWELDWREAPSRLPTEVAIVKARRRLGRAPLELLFRAAAAPLAIASTPGAFYHGMRLISLDQTLLDLANTAVNDQVFGRPGSTSGDEGAPLPQLRLVGLVECGTGAITDATFSPSTSSPQELCDRLLGALPTGTLCLADRRLYSSERFEGTPLPGVQLLWEAPPDLALPEQQQLVDGSYLTCISPSGASDPQEPGGTSVRVVECQLDDPNVPSIEVRGRLLTTLLDPETAPASELAGIYSRRAKIQALLDDLKADERSRNLVLRSKDHDGVYQEAYGCLCAHYAIRRLMTSTGLAADFEPDRLVFGTPPAPREAAEKGI